VSEPSDMSPPVTRGELRLELGELRLEFGELRMEFGELRLEFGELRLELEEMEQRLDQRMDQKLEIWAGAVNARTDSIARSSEQRIGQLIAEVVASSEQRTAERIASQGRELHEDLARHVRAFEESMRSMVSVVDDKYADLPGRVTALERNGAPPASPRKRRRRAS
jgi:DNA anti-recombination protein RmuC